MFGLDTTETIFSLAIAIVYPFFFSKLTSKVSKIDSINQMCDKFDMNIKYGLYSSYNNWNSSLSYNSNRNIDSDGLKKSDDPAVIAKREEYKKCEEDRKIKLDQAQYNQHIMLIFIAFFGILVSSAIQSSSTKVGVGLGGVLTLMVALFSYWHKYKENSKLAILGVGFVSLLYLSIKLYTLQSITDIFSLVEFGSK
jgi:hypothetical protein